MARPDDTKYPSGMITADDRTIGEKFSDWYERVRTLPVGRGVGASPEQMDAMVLDAAKKVGHGTVGWLIGRWTAGVADIPVSTYGKSHARNELKKKLHGMGIEVEEVGKPLLTQGAFTLKTPEWELKDAYGNTRLINADKVSEGTYSRDWGEVYAGLVGVEVTPEMQSVYQVGRFIGSLKPTSKVIQATTGKIPARPGLLKTAQAGWAGITANSLGQVEDIIAGKRDSFSFKEAHQTGAIFTAFGGVIEGAKAATGAISDAYMVNRFMKAHPEALNVLSKGEMRALGTYGRAVRNGMNREASLKVFGKKMRPIWEKLDKFRSDIEYKPPMPKLLPEKAGLSTGTAQDKIWEQMSPEQKIATTTKDTSLLDARGKLRTDIVIEAGKITVPEPIEPKNIYMRIPIEQVREDAALGVSLAKEALVRMNPDAALGQDLLQRPTKKQFATIHQLKAKHGLTDEEYREALKYATGIDSMANMSKYDADLAMQHMQNFDNMVGMVDVVSKAESVLIDPSIPNQSQIRKAAGSDEVFHKTILYSNKVGGAPSNNEVPDLEWRQKRYGQDLISVTKSQKRHAKKVAKRETKGRQANIVNPWSSARYALAEAGVKSGVPLRRVYSDMIADSVAMANRNASTLQERLKRAGAPKLGSPLTFEEGKQASEWLFTDGDAEPELKEHLWQTMSSQTQKIASEINGFLQDESAKLIRWKRWLNWDDAARTADAQIERLRDKKVKITKKRLDRIMAPVKLAKPINAPQSALKDGRDAKDVDQLQDWLATQTWGTRKFYYMTEREIKDLTDLYPTGVIPEELEEAANLVGNPPETNLPETMTREGKGKIAKGGNLLAAVLNHANRVGISAATHDDLQNFWEAFASTNPSPSDISSVRMLVNNALGKHHVIEPWVKIARGMNNAFWRAHLGLSPKRAMWFSYRNVHQNVAYGLSQTAAKEVAISAKQITTETTKAMFTGNWSDNVDEVNPWIRDDYNEFWESRISQRKQLQHQMILQKQGAIVGDFGNKAVAIIDAIGSAPVYSDEVNRLGIWPNLHQTAYRNVQSFVRGDIDGKKFWSRLDMDTLHLDQRLEMQRLMDEGRWRELVRNWAEYKTENIHFRYETALRSVAEQTPGGRATIGLMTFPRGTFEIMYQNGYKPFVQGFESGNYKQSAKGFKTVMAGIIGSRVARWMLYAVTGRIAYGIFDTVFQYAPVAPGPRRIQEMFDSVSESVYRASKGEAGIPDIVDSVMSTAVYQLELFIPMMDVLIDKYESDNDVYGVRLYSMLKKEALRRYRDEEGEAYRQASRNTMEKIQHTFWSGAEKGKELKK